MTIKEAIIEIREHGIDLGAGDFVDTEALRVAVEVMTEVVDKENGVLPTFNIITFDVKPDTVWANIDCGNCGAHLHIDSYPTDVWNDYMKDRYTPRKIPNFCPNCGMRVCTEEPV